MKTNDILRRIVSLLLILTLVTSAFVDLPLSVSAEDTGLQGGQSNIVNGSFEKPSNYRIEDLAKASPSCYKYAPQGNVPGWNTTSTTSKIELGWMNNKVSIDKASPHMKPTVAKASYTADGYQLAEVIAEETNSSLYQKIAVNQNENYNWTVHHRGRSGVDTLALIITDYAGSVYDKSSNTATDHFNQILNWLKNTKGVTAPADGEETATYTVYTTNLTNDPSKGPSFEGEEANWFSDQKDESHPVKFEIHLMSTGTNRWGEYTGSYTSDKNKDILFVLTSFDTSYSKATGGNLIDKLSFVDKSGKNLLLNPSFDGVNANANYKNFPAANADNRTEDIGWSTTAYARVIEIGNFEKGNAYGITAIAEVFNKPYIRDGEQFAELNADEESSLYQIVDTDPGKMYKWSLSHRGRDAIDTMALIIGPAQFDNNGNSISPKKTSPTARDQLMQIIGWLYSQTEMPLQLPTDGGCSNKIKVYTPKFNSNGGWVLPDNKIVPFSFYKDSTHTEEWSVWVIASKNDKWYDYGELDSTAKYSYECVIPEGQEKTIFGFVSHSSYKADGTKNSMSYGNLLDNIAFKEYYYAKVEVAMNDSHGKAQIVVNESSDFIHDKIDDESLKSGWALIGSSFTVHVTEAEGENKRTFIGAYINGQFVKSSDPHWVKNEVTGEYTYTFSNINSAIKVNIIFAAKQIYYDSRSGYPYQYGPDDNERKPEVPMGIGEREIYKSHAPEADDGWKFVGWKYINPAGGVTIFDAEHTVKLIKNSEYPNSSTFSVYDSKDESKTVSGIPYDEGITFLGEWKYRQSAVAQTYNEKNFQYSESTDGGTVDINVTFGANEEKINYPAGATDDKAVGKELYASSDDTYVTVTAKRKPGYTFHGWYDIDGKLISKNANYVYKVKSGVIETLYARFDPAGCDLWLNCSTNSSVSEDINKYFKINCLLSGLHAGISYTLSYESGSSVSNTTFVADSSGQATVILNMKHGDCAKFIYLPVDSKYTIVADSESSAGFGIKGEVKTEKKVTKPDDSTVAVPVLTEHIIFLKASQTALIKDGKYYEGIAEGEEITITKNSSYTFQVETRYNPSLYEGLRASLCFYSSNETAKEFFIGTRILMIDLSNSASPKYYGYTVNSRTSAIALSEFTELGSADAKFATKTGDMLTEKLVFIVDYVGTENLADSGKVSLVYNDTNNELKSILNPAKKTVNIGGDKTGITANVGDGRASSGGPFVINVTLSESKPAINTTYKEDGNSEYAVKLSLASDKQLPDGSYAEVDGNKYFLCNGYIKIPSLISGKHKVSVYTPVPVELTDGKVKFNLALSDAVSASPTVPAEISTSVEFTYVDVAMDADVLDKVLNPNTVSQLNATLKYIGIDTVELTVSKKNENNSLLSKSTSLPTDKDSITVPIEFTAVSGETYIFSFVGYVNGAPVLEDKCCVVGGYISKP